MGRHTHSRSPPNLHLQPIKATKMKTESPHIIISTMFSWQQLTHWSSSLWVSQQTFLDLRSSNFLIGYLTNRWLLREDDEIEIFVYIFFSKLISGRIEDHGVQTEIPVDEGFIS